MKTLLTMGLLMLLGTTARAWDYGYGNTRDYKDSWGHSYKNSSTLDKDTDGDGVSNRYDYNDRNANIRNRGDVDYSNPYGTRTRSYRKSSW